MSGLQNVKANVSVFRSDPEEGALNLKFGVKTPNDTWEVKIPQMSYGGNATVRHQSKYELFQEGLEMYKPHYDSLVFFNYQTEHQQFFAQNERVQLVLTTSENNTRRFTLFTLEGEAILADFTEYDLLQECVVKAKHYLSETLGQKSDEAYASRLKSSVLLARDNGDANFGVLQSNVEFGTSDMLQSQPNFPAPEHKSPHRVWNSEDENTPVEVLSHRVAEEGDMDEDYLRNRKFCETIHSNLGELDSSKLKKKYDKSTFREVRYTQKTIYWGQFDRDDIRNGYGVLTYENGNLYEGEWFENVSHGYGRFVSYSGDYYEGFWQDDKKEGHGTIYESNGTTYVGRWVNDQRNGKGILEVPNKVRYEGFFQDGLFIHGVGVEMLANGKKYDGKFQEAHYHGEGSLSWPDGTIYEGMFEQGRAFGRGTMKKSSGVTYTGEFQHGWFEGIGVLTFTDGSRHEGGFSKGLRHGKGTYYATNGRTFKQVWKNGEKDESCTVF